MIDVGALWLLRPLWLLAIPAAVLLAFAAARARRGLSGWTTVIDRRLMPVLEELGHVVPALGRGNWPLLCATVVLASLALAGPATRNPAVPSLRNMDIVFLLIDVSESMTRGGAFDDARAAAAQVLADADGRPVAMAIFASETYLVSAPTDDPRQLETAVAVLGTGIVPDAGSRPDRALAMARETLADASARSADILLVTDGGGIGADTLHQAELLRGSGNRVSAVFVEPRRQPYGMPEPNRTVLTELVAGGTVLDVDQSGELARLLATGHLSAEGDRKIRALVFRDHGRWLLVLCLPPALLLFRRRRTA